MNLTEANALLNQLGDKRDIIVALIDLKTGEDMEKLSNQINQLGVQLNARFDAMDAKIDGMDAKFEAKFDAMDTKFTAQFNALKWYSITTIGFIIAATGLALTILK